MAVAGPYYAVGARWADDLRGAVYVYKRLPTLAGQPPRLELLTRFQGADNVRRFGWRVALSGSTLAVSGTGDASARARGEAYVFGLQSPGADLTDNLRIPTPATAESFGTDIALCEDLLVVTARFSTFGHGGVAYVYRRPEEGWSHLDTADVTLLTSPEPHSLTGFGASVATDGEVIFVGAPSYRAAEGRGAVFVFEPGPGGWDGGVRQPTSALAAIPNVSFGRDLALSGDLLVVSATAWRNEAGILAGAAVLFARPASGWSSVPVEPLALLTPSDPHDRDVFAGPVAATDRFVAVGAPGDPLTGYEPPGAVYIFARPQQGWQFHDGHEALKVTPPSGAMGDRFGSAVAADPNGFLVGAITETGHGAFLEGAAYAYRVLLDNSLEIPSLGGWELTSFGALLVLLGLRSLMSRGRS